MANDPIEWLNALLASKRPEDYSKYVEITDDRALLLQAALLQKDEEAADAQHLLDTLKAEADAIKGRMFLRLQEAYPEIKGRGRGVIEHEGRLYYVSADPQRQPRK